MQIHIEPGLPEGSETEVLIRCVQEDDTVRAVAALLTQQNKRIPVQCAGETKLLSPKSVLYAESVDSATFLYTTKEMYQTLWSLAALQETFGQNGLFRCSKSMLLNLHKVSSLQASENSRIIAVLENGEKLLVSRHYARQLRNMLMQTV